MDKEVCIIKNAIDNTHHGIKGPNCSSLNGNIEERLMSSSAKLNQALLVSLDSQSISSVIQQAKDAKLNSFQALNIYPRHPNDFSELSHKAYEHHDHSKSHALGLKHLHRPEKLLERSRNENMVDNINQTNALFVVDSSGKLNVVDGPNHQFLLNNNAPHKIHEHDQLFGMLGSDLPQLKKAFNHQYGNLNYPSDNLSISAPSLSLNDNYFNLFSNATNTPSPISGDNLSSQSISANASFSQSSSPNVQTRQLVDQPIANGSSSFQRNGGRTVENVPVVHTRGRKRSKKGPFICPECRKEFSNQSTLTKHMITHSDERKFVCPQCSKAFKRHDHLNGHMLTHREHKPYACDIEGCDKSYCDARSLRRHKEKHKENALQCNEGLLLSQKLPVLSVTDKGIANNIYHLPVNASAHLQYMALQQQKTQPEGDADFANSSFSKLASIDKSSLANPTDSTPLSLKSNEDELSRRILVSSFNQNFANENALLHQLLTTQDRNAFKSPSNSSHINSNSNSSSTVIKINDGYLNLPNDLPSNQLSLANSIKCPSSKEGDINEPNIFSEKLDSNLELTDNAIDQEDEENILTECTVCPKKFKSSSSLNGHMRLHGGYFKMNYLLPPKLGTDETLDKINSQSSVDLNLTKDDNANMGYSIEYQQPKIFDSLVKDFIYETNNSKEVEFNGISLFPKSNVVDYPGLNRPMATNTNDHFKTPLQYESHAPNLDKLDLINSNSLYSNQLYVEKSNANLMPIEQAHCSNNIVRSQPKQQVQVPQINEMMFSPITPVTPLNKNSTQFTFDFSNVNKLPAEAKLDQTAPIACKTDSIHYQTNIDNDLVEDAFCFEEQKDGELLEKGNIEIQPIDINDSEDNFSDLNTSRLKDFANEHCLDKNVNTLEAASNEPNFDNFDLPSGKLTSDLYNRRLRKHFDDSNKTRERELSIKQIAASLQSFSQSYERSHHNNLANQQMNHSYSVPTTPLVMGNNYANNQDSYHPSHLSHHSLPATPIDSSHFTFNVCHQASLPSTPLDTDHQFTFAPSQTDQQSSELLNAPNFDLSCLNESQYSSDFMYNSNLSKDLESHFIESDNLMAYEPLNPTDSSEIVSESNETNINFNGEIYSRIDSFNYNQTCLDHTQEKKNSTHLPIFVNTQDSQTCMSNCKQTDTSGKIVTEQISSNEEEMKQTILQIERDINSNYIVNSVNKPDPLLENELKIPSPKSVIKASPLKAFLSKKHSPPNTNAIPLAIKKKHRPAPLYIPPHVNTFMYHSRLRSPRFWNSSNPEITQHISPPPYTPPPMLSPVRSGSGLFWKLNNTGLNSKLSSSISFGSSKSMLKRANYELNEQHETEQKTPTTAYEPLIYEYDIPQTDIQPHVNIGPNFQARIPAFNSSRRVIKFKLDKEDLLWDPQALDNISEDKLNLYMQVSCSMCLPGQSNNMEYAMHLLHQNKGNVVDALAKLVNPSPMVEQTHTLSDYRYADNQIWTSNEITMFQESLLKNDKDFYLISHEVKTKSVKECIEFYYLWKKHFPDIIKRLRFLRRKRESLFYNTIPNNTQTGVNKNDSTESRKSSNGNCSLEHELSHSQDVSKRVSNIQRKSKNGLPYACAKCGKTFKKLRSRSAHMKIHGNI